MKIAPKLISGYFLIAILVVMIGLGSFTMMRSMKDKYDEVVTQSFPIVNAIEEVRLLGMRLILLVKGQVMVQIERVGIEGSLDEEDLSTVMDEMRADIVHPFESALARYEELIGKSDRDDRETVKRIRSAGDNIILNSNNIISLIKTRNYQLDTLTAQVMVFKKAIISRKLFQ